MSQVRALYGPMLFLPVIPPMLDINILFFILKANPIRLREESDTETRRCGFVVALSA